MEEELYKAWLAGFFDGEGTICFTSSDRDIPRVALYQKNQLDLLVEVQNRYGGDIQCIKRSGVHGLQIQRREEVKKFLSDMLPYLRVKRKKAEIMLAFCCIDAGPNQNGFLKEKLLRSRYADAFRSLTQ